MFDTYIQYSLSIMSRISNAYCKFQIQILINPFYLALHNGNMSITNKLIHYPEFWD